jgi:hypothetical protein
VDGRQALLEERVDGQRLAQLVLLDVDEADACDAPKRLGSYSRRASGRIRR